METQIQLIALTVLDMKDNDRSWPEFTNVWKKNLEIIDYNTFTIYDQLEQYKSVGKIQFSKT